MKTMPVVTSVATDVEIICRLLEHDRESEYALTMLRTLRDYLARIKAIRDQEPQGDWKGSREE